LEDLSFWWGKDGMTATDVVANFELDLAIARLAPFDPAWVTGYPVFKDPSAGILAGTSLCRLGFPFHEFTPTYEKGKGFRLPDAALPAPVFPLEGIMTRNIVAGQTRDGKHEIKFLETSSPGLRGQSGGPVFDQEGRVWGIQSRTVHLPLGFSPPVPDGRKKEVEHQFLNVGWAVHPDVVYSFLKENRIKFTVA
jgi:Trypsin-like peptidase domain